MRNKAGPQQMMTYGADAYKTRTQTTRLQASYSVVEAQNYTKTLG